MDAGSDPARGYFIPYQGQGPGIGTDICETRFLATPGEIGILGQETVAGMNRLGSRVSGCGQDGIDVQVTLQGGRRADEYRLISHLHVKSRAVHCGIYRHRTNPHFPAGANDPKCDFPAIGYQNLLEHPFHSLQICFDINSLRTFEAFEPLRLVGCLTSKTQRTRRISKKCIIFMRHRVRHSA